MSKQKIYINDSFKVFQEKVNIISRDVGWRGDLTTAEDSDLIGAINEHDAELGTITSGAMGTTASTVSTAIKELDTRLDTIYSTLISSAMLNMRDASATNIISGNLNSLKNVNIGGNLQVGGTLTVDGVVNMKAGSNGSVTLGDANTDNIVFLADVNSHVIPNTDNTYDLGSSAQQWRDMHVHGTGNIDTISADVVTISNTLDVNTSATIATAKIEDLTNNRIVIVGTGGELEDNSTLTFDGTTLTVGKTSIAQVSGNTDIGGDLDVTGNVTSTGWALKIAAETGTTDNITLGDTITFEAGEGINTTVSNNKINITSELATATNKGVASFAPADFNISSGAVSIASISNAQIDNSFINIAASSGAANAVNLGETLTLTAGEGINTAVSGNNITVAAELATASNKGIASFSSDNFEVTSGVVTVKNNGIILGTETTGNYISTITGTANEIVVTGSGAENSNVTIALPDDVVIGNNLTVTSDLNVRGDLILSGATKIAAHEFKIADGTTGVPSQNGIISIDRGNADSAQLLWNESLNRWQAGVVDDMNLIALENDSASFTQLSVKNNLVVTGNLEVRGTTTTVNTTEVNIADNIIVLNSNHTGVPNNTLRSGIEIERGSATNAKLQYNESIDQWEFTGPKTGILAVTNDIKDATVTITAGTDLSTGGNFTSNQSSNKNITVNHSNITRTNTTITASPAYGASFAVIDNLTTNARGHVTGVRTKTVTLPATYSHPSYSINNVSIDTGALTGATVVSDLDFNIKTDALGHVTSADATVATRTLTLANLGYTGASNANYYSLPLATGGVMGGIKLFNNADQSVAANSITSTAGRTYGIQLNSANQGVVNVPWINTTYSVGDGGLTQKNFTTALKSKLDGIAAGAQVNVPTNLGSGTSTTDVTIVSSTGSNTTVPGATTSAAGCISAADKTKLDGIATGATNVTNNNQLTNGAGYTTNTGDITGVTAGTNLNGGGSSGGVTLNLDSTITLTTVNAGTVNTTSDERAKIGITPITEALNKVQQLGGYSFTLKATDEKSSGVIAQEVQKVMPELVQEGAEGLLSVQYGNMVGLLIEAIKEQQAQIDELKQKLNG